MDQSVTQSYYSPECSNTFVYLQAGAKLDIQDKSMRTPLLEAIVNNHVEVTRYLVQSGACVYHTVSVW